MEFTQVMQVGPGVTRSCPGLLHSRSPRPQAVILILPAVCVCASCVCQLRVCLLCVCVVFVCQLFALVVWCASCVCSCSFDGTFEGTSCVCQLWVCQTLSTFNFFNS